MSDTKDGAVCLDFATQHAPNTSAQPPGDDGQCPKCGAETLGGYGLAGGGSGAYWMCENDACDYFFKHQEKGS